MPVRNVGKWVCVAFIASATAGAVASCGSSQDASKFDGGAGDDSSTGGDGTTSDGSVIGFGDSGNGGDDGSSGCTPKTCQELGYNCGQAVSCGTPIDCTGGVDANHGCPAGQVCANNMCGTGTESDGASGDGSSSCVAKTCSQLGYNCGEAVQCGAVINCNPSDTGTGCTAPAYCGGGGANICGAGGSADGGTTCKPKTCADLGYNCGAANDGCGHVLASCGTCTSPQYCGGGGYNLCGPTNIAICDGGTASTSLSGFVYDPANHLPVYNALVYAPVGTPPTPSTGVSGASCGCSAPPAYASTNTAVDGSFTLTGVPDGASVTIVVQLGKWQRIFTQTIGACAQNTVSNGTNGSHFTLPSKHADGNIPLFAVDTGGVDAMECVLLKMGIDPGEFTDPNLDANGVPQSAGRVHFYEGNIVAGGAVIDGNTPLEASLTESLTTLESYDVTLFPCQGGAGTYDTAKGYPNTLTNLVSYTGVGGRAFMTHFHYDMLKGNGSFNGTANWDTGAGSWGNYYGDTKYNADIETTGFPTGVALAEWLDQVNYIDNGGTDPAIDAGVKSIPVGVIRKDFKSVISPSQLWLYTAGTTGGPAANDPIHYTFDTPFNQTPTCGRVVFSDFHVESQPNATEFTGDIFPNECPGGTAPDTMTPQEALLEFMLFDLTSCVSAPTCTPVTCAELQAVTPGTCGTQGNGCGTGTIDCGACAPPDAGSCVPQTCAQQGVACGQTADGCGNVISCPSCPSGETCVNGQCNSSGTCTPKTCAQQGVQCGFAGDGCGNILTCPTCPNSETCNTATGQCNQGPQ